jgi:serine/threonine protein kinase/lipoprotein NlpI
MSEDGSSTLRRDSKARELADEIVRRWHTGTELPSAAKYFALHPELAEHDEAGVHLVYEEACLRREAGDQSAFDEILGRYPRWRGQLEVMLRCHCLLEEPRAEPDWPAVGDLLGDFRVEAELGRGGLGRVFLATERGLAGRPVVLKVTARAGHEHVSLARVQHTHIMPLYSTQEDGRRNLRVLCMPYFGGAPLDRLLEALRPVPLARRTGADLLAALDRVQAGSPRPMPARGPARKMLAHISYAEAVCWVGACLADALQYAHERGLVHLDVKPSNILLAADGEPMLLDFNVAQSPIRPDGPAAEAMGGTPLYMPPEQEAAMQALKQGRPAPGAVDGRADVYALGRLLYEALGGAHPPADGPAPQLDRINPQVSPSLADVLARCLARRPEARYQDAAALAADLRRHLSNLPLKGVPTRSLAERWRKWRRRRPYALARAVAVVAVLAAAVGVGLREVEYRRQRGGETARRWEAAVEALAEGRQQVEAGDSGHAVEALQRGLAEAGGLPEGEELVGRLTAELKRAHRAEAAQRLHDLADRLRFQGGGEFLPRGGARPLRAAWKALWDRRVWLLDQKETALPEAAESQLEEDLRDLGTIWADLAVRLAGPGEADRARREALEVLAQAEKQFGPSAALYVQRQACAQALGRHDEAREAARLASAWRPRSGWDHAALGRSLLQRGRLEAAAAALAQATELDPGAFWPSFYQGVCAYRQQRYDEAVTAFRVCLALAPRGGGDYHRANCYYHRGLARAARGDKEAALDDYSRALALDPGLGAAALNRGLLRYGKKQYDAALADLKQALDGGCDPAVVHYNRALVHLARGDRFDALRELDLALRANPHHAEARRLRDRLTGQSPANRQPQSVGRTP